MSEKASVKMTTNSWHYKLVKLVLGKAAPTPQNMHNLCPYFWLMIFSILISPIVLPIKAIVWICDKIFTLVDDFAMNSLIMPAATSWEENLTDLDVYQIFCSDEEIKKSYKKAFGEYDDYSNKSILTRDEFTFRWFKKKYNKEALSKDSTYYSREYTKAFEKWRKEREAEMAEVYKLQSERAKEKHKKEIVYQERMSDFRDGIDKFFDKLRDSVSSWKNIIKWTKRTVGLLVTLVGLIATYFVVNFIGRGVLWLVENWDWNVIIAIGVFALIIGVLILITYLMKAWITYMADKGTNLWYVKVLYYLALGIYWPFKVLFYHLIWQFFLVNLWFILVKGAKLIWGSLMGFLGIFGEYFGASYTDYCPGIEWEEENK